MKKTLRIIILLLALFVGFTLRANAATADASLIIVNPGADMSREVNVSWHTTTEGTMVRYTLASDTAYANKRFAVAECKPVPFEGKQGV